MYLINYVSCHTTYEAKLERVKNVSLLTINGYSICTGPLADDLGPPLEEKTLPKFTRSPSVEVCLIPPVMETDKRDNNLI